MIDIGFTQLALIALIALIVIGPEKLPTVVRMVGSLLGRAQRYLNEIKIEVSREIALDELCKMHEEVEQSVKEVIQSSGASIQAVTEDIANTIYARPSANHLGNQSSMACAEKYQQEKLKTFRQKRLAYMNTLPIWYKRQNKYKTHIASAAARLVKYRAKSF